MPALAMAAASALGTRDPARVANHLYGELEPAELATGREFSTAALVRAVLDPPRHHPVPRLDPLLVHNP